MARPSHPPQLDYSNYQGSLRSMHDCDLPKAFKLPHLHNYMIKLCRQQAEVIQNQGNANIRKARHIGAGTWSR
jgi:hypothetical protein